MKSHTKITLEEAAHLEMVLRLDAANNHDVRVLAAAGDTMAQKEADTRGFAPSWWKAPLSEWSTIT